MVEIQHLFAFSELIPLLVKFTVTMNKSILLNLRILPLILGIAISLLVSIIYWNYASNKEDSSAIDVVTTPNTPLPECNLYNVQTLQDFTKRIKQNKVLLVYFATGCSACKREFDMLSQDYAKISPEVQIYGVSVEQEDIVRKFAEKNNFQFPILLDKGADLLSKSEIKSFPTNFIIQDGIIKKYWIGYVNDSESLLDRIKN